MPTEDKAAVIIPAAGRGRRMGLDTPKQFFVLADLPIFVHTVRAFQGIAAIETIVLVAPPDLRRQVEEIADRFDLRRNGSQLLIVNGGRTRQDSVKAGLDSLPDEIELVLVHDGSRPLVTAELITACLCEARCSGASMAAVPVSDTLKSVSTDKKTRSTVDRRGLWQAQTPQAAKVSLLRKAYAAAEKDGFVGTDEASLIEHFGIPVAVVPGSEKNIKITRPEDLIIAEALLMHEKQKKATVAPARDLRIGHGYDAHQLVPGRPLVLGGVSVPHPAGLLGHSDADVLTHALCDAILGAVGLGDIGKHFPDTDQRFKDIQSLQLLEEVMTMARGRGYGLVNADLTAVAQQPKLSAYLARMRQNIASACRVGQQQINIKATTTEKMGFAGREEGIAAYAIVLMSS